MNNGFVEEMSTAERKENINSKFIMHLERKLLEKTYKNLNLHLKNSVTRKSFD